MILYGNILQQGLPGLFFSEYIGLYSIRENIGIFYIGGYMTVLFQIITDTVLHHKYMGLFYITDYIGLFYTEDNMGLFYIID